jgi:hypothetical protein
MQNYIETLISKRTNKRQTKKGTKKQGMVVHACNSSIQEAEKDQESEASLGYIVRLCLANKK